MIFLVDTNDIKTKKYIKGNMKYVFSYFPLKKTCFKKVLIT